MRRGADLSLLAALTFAVSPSAAQSNQDVRCAFDKDTDFSKFKTYKWVRIKGVTQAKGLTDKQIKAAFEPELADKGLTKVNTETADLFIGYQFGVEQTHIFSAYRRWEHGTGWDTDARQEDDRSALQASTIHEGELSLDMYESAKHTLAWRGVASKAIDPKAKPNERQEHLVEAVKKLMELYPPVALVRH